MKADAILCSDLHIRDSIPECRTDDFMKTQEVKYEFLRELQHKHGNIPILVAGDVFHHWKPSPFLISWALQHLPDQTITIAGQHDLPNHNLDNINKSGIYTLWKAGKIEVLNNNQIMVNGFGIWGFPWNIDLTGVAKLRNCDYYKIALIHHLVYKDKEPFPGAAKVGGTGKSILKQMPGFDLVVSGDNHQTFTATYGDQLLVNPGSFMRTTAAQADHKPCVFLWYAKTNEVEQVFLPINKNAVSREHIEVKEHKDERIEAFVSKLKSDVELGISYSENMKLYIAKNKISKEVQTEIWEALGL